MKRIIITGATGFLGSALVHHFANLGHDVVGLSRSSGFDLRHPNFDFRIGDIVIHAAYNFEAYGWTEIHRTNVEGSRRLIDKALDAGVDRFIFVSSMAAFDDCKSLYGRAKLEVEKHFGPRILSLRFGLILDDDFARGEANDTRSSNAIGRARDSGATGGMSSALRKIVSTLPILPLPDGGLQHLYTLTRADACAFMEIFAFASAAQLPQAPVALATTGPVSFRQLLETTARALNKPARFISVPSVAILAGLRSLEAIGLRPRTRADSLISLLNQDPYPPLLKDHPK